MAGYYYVRFDGAQATLRHTTQLFKRSTKKASARGVVRGKQSRFSASRLRRLFARLTPFLEQHASERRVFFVTLTFAIDVQHDYNRLRVWLDRCRRAELFVIWRAEYTLAGRVHYHCVVVGDYKAIPSWSHGICEIERAKLSSAVVRYLSSEMTKLSQSSSADHPGRWWGVINRRLAVVDTSYLKLSDHQFYSVRRLMRRSRRFHVSLSGSTLIWADTENFDKFWRYIDNSAKTVV